MAMRGWRDCRVPQECLLRFLSGALEQLDESVAQDLAAGHDGKAILLMAYAT